MPMEIISDGFVGVLRLIFRVFVQVFCELLLQGVGYLICRIFSKNVEPDGFLATVVGVIFWILACYLVYIVFGDYAVDSCLDSGGRYNYETSVCEH